MPPRWPGATGSSSWRPPATTARTTGRLADPAIDPYVIAVGAADTDVGTAATPTSPSPASPTAATASQPRLVAPGVHIASLRVPGSCVDTAYCAARRVGTRLIRGSGTSQSTAMVSGAAALLLSMPPETSRRTRSRRASRARPMRSAAPVPGRGRRADQREVPGAGRTLQGYRRQTFPPTGGGTLDGSRGTRRALDGSAGGRAGHLRCAVDGRRWRPTRRVGSPGRETGSGTGRPGAGSSWAGTSWAGTSWAGSSWAVRRGPAPRGRGRRGPVRPGPGLRGRAASWAGFRAGTRGPDTESGPDTDG